jgi:hypothetical protein
MKRPYVSLSEALDRLQIRARDRASAEAWIQFLSGHGGSRDSYVDADGARRTHCVSGIAYQEQTVTRPIVDQANDAFKWEKRREVFQPVGEIGEDRVEFPNPAGYRRYSIFAPAFPFAGGQCDPGLDVVRVLGQNQASHFLAQ